MKTTTLKTFNGVFTPKPAGVFTHLALILIFAFSISAFSQTQSPIYTGLQTALDLHGTNSLANADEINLTPVFKWDSALRKAGGGVKADWWVTGQQGAFLAYDEFAGRKSYFSFGYEARTVFKIVEVKAGVGTRQDNDDPFGNLKLFIAPSASVRIVHTDNLDFRITAGADVFTSGRPNPFIGVTFTLFKL